tara:strand:+ start:95 stop:349 length:255 start_codon:yes stop_codon:yes gene_type:complete
MEKKPINRNLSRMLRIVLMTSLTGLGYGCATSIKLDATKRLILNNERGFQDAYMASPQAKQFVESALEQIVEYERQLEKKSITN